MYRKPGIVEFAYPLGIFEVALCPVKSVQIVTVLLVGHVNGVGCVGINRFCLGFVTPVIRIDVPNAVGHISFFMCFDLFSRRLGLFFFRLFFLFRPVFEETWFVLFSLVLLVSSLSLLLCWDVCTSRPSIGPSLRRVERKERR